MIVRTRRTLPPEVRCTCVAFANDTIASAIQAEPGHFEQIWHTKIRVRQSAFETGP
jgi:hypothetical protein